jgi:hypothetical protein
VHVRKLDAHEDLLMGETVKVIIQLSIISMEVHIELSLKKQVIGIDIIESKEP